MRQDSIGAALDKGGSLAGEMPVGLRAGDQQEMRTALNRTLARRCEPKLSVWRRRRPRPSCRSAELDQRIAHCSLVNPTLNREQVYRRLRAEGLAVTLPMVRRVRSALPAPERRLEITWPDARRETVASLPAWFRQHEAELRALDTRPGDRNLLARLETTLLVKGVAWHGIACRVKS